MKKLLFTSLSLLIASFLWSSACFASGFALYENSPSGAAVSGAFVATADDVSAVWYNPAGLTQLEGTHVMGGFTAYSSNGGVINFENGERTRVNGGTIPLPYLYASHKLNDKFWVGFGIFSPFGLEADYDEDWGGRYNTYYSGNVAREFNTNLVYKVNDKLSLGAGVSLQQFEVEFKQKLSAGLLYLKAGGSESDLLYTNTLSLLDDFDQHLKADEDAEFRYNLSLLYTITDTISFGLTYRSEVDYTLTGSASYKGVPGLNSGDIYDADISGDITLPMIIWSGIACKVTPKFTVEADLVMTGWSSYDKMQFNIENSLGTQTVNKDWDDSYCIRLGAEYQLTEALAIRGGYLYDESPIPAETLDYAMPSSDRNMFTTGVGYTFGSWTIDAHYAYLNLIGSRSIDARFDEFILSDSRVEDARVHQIGFATSYKF